MLIPAARFPARARASREHGTRALVRHAEHHPDDVKDSAHAPVVCHRSPAVHCGLAHQGPEFPQRSSLDLLDHTLYRCRRFQSKSKNAATAMAAHHRPLMNGIPA